MILNIGGGGGLPIRLIVTAPTGSAVSVTRGTTVLAANEVDGVWTFAIPSLGVWTIHATIDGQSLTQNVDISKVGQYNVTLEKPISGTLNDNDWATIKSVADESKGANYWAVGDTKEITINGKLSDGLTLSNYETWVYIIGFDHNKDVEGTGIAFQGFKTAQSGGTDICLCGNGYASNKSSGQWFNMNNNNSTGGGWNGCNMRNNTLPVAKATFPHDLQAAIKTTTLYTDNTGSGSTSPSYVTATQEDLYLLAEFEIFGARSYANTAEQNYQKQYAYYVAGNSKVKYRHDSMAMAAFWWERSVYAANTTDFCIVHANGLPSSYGASLSMGLAPAFKVGGVKYTPLEYIQSSGTQYNAGTGSFGIPGARYVTSVPIGNSVYCEENGTRTEFIVVHQGNPDISMYDSSCDGTWVVRKDCYNEQAWSANNNKWQLASLQQWLRDTYIGYLNISDNVKQVKIPHALGLASETVYTGANGLASKVFLLSAVELGFATKTGVPILTDGTKLDYFNQTNEADPKRVAKFNGTAAAWWTRSPEAGSTNGVVYVEIGGTDSNNAATATLGVRPAFILSSTTYVDSDNNLLTAPPITQ